MGITIVTLELKDLETIESIKLNNGRVLGIDSIVISGICQDCTHGHIWKQAHPRENDEPMIIQGCDCYKWYSSPPTPVKKDGTCEHWSQ